MIHLSIPNLAGNEKKYLLECLDTNFVSTAGSFVGKFENEFAKYVGCKRAIAVVNGTSAIHLSLIINGIGPSHEVIVPNLTFIAPLNAVSYTGATPLIVDSNQENLGIDVLKLKQFLEKNCFLNKDGDCINRKSGKIIKAIIPVYIFGHFCFINEIVELADRYNLIVIEDASEAIGAMKEGRSAGTFGQLGCFSFNGNKIITSGGGGMIVTNDEKMADHLKHLSTTAKSEAINFFHDEIGYNYRMVNPLAAIGLAQLEQINHFLKNKKENIKKYIKGINNPLLEVYLPDDFESSNHWFYTILIKDQFKEYKNKIINYLIEQGIEVRPVWTPMNNLPMFKDLAATELLVSENLFQRIINIPCSTNLTTIEIETVIKKINSIQLNSL